MATPLTSSFSHSPGTALYTAFGAMAGFSGYLLWDCFMGKFSPAARTDLLPPCRSDRRRAGLDSYQFPIKAFGDIGFRVYGTWCRYLFNVLQAVQLICNVGAIIISNGEALSEAVKFKLCYAICCLVWALAGFVLGQIRTLQKFGWLANVAVFINLTIMFITMGAAAHSPPLYSAAKESAGASVSLALVTPVNGKYPPVQHSGGLPSSGSFAGTLNGAMQAVYSYGGSMIFPEFMAEMRRPRDFLKGMWGAQIFIYICYMLYGLYIYGFQGKVLEWPINRAKYSDLRRVGQYVQTPAYLGISSYGLQTAGNSLAIVSALIAAALYGNIGIKGERFRQLIRIQFHRHFKSLM